MERLLEKLIGAVNELAYSGIRDEFNISQVSFGADHIRFDVHVSNDQELSSFSILETNLEAQTVETIEQGVHIWYSQDLDGKEFVELVLGALKVKGIA